MPFIKNNISENDLEKLFDENDNSKFVKDNKKDKENLLSDELNVKTGSDGRIKRPDEYKGSDYNTKKTKELKDAEDSKNVYINGNVSREVFSKLAELKKNASLEEYKEKQKKLPIIQPDAVIRLYSDKPECKFHVYNTVQMYDSQHVMAACKYCSAYKLFPLSEWFDYQLKNKKYL